MIATYVVCLLLIGLSGVLLDMHRRSWRAAQANQELSPADRRFALSQYRRRMQASGIIAVLGIAVGCEPLIPHEPLSFVLYLGSILGACLAVVVLAAIDAWSTRQHIAVEQRALSGPGEALRQIPRKRTRTKIWRSRPANDRSVPSRGRRNSTGRAICSCSEY